MTLYADANGQLLTHEDGQLMSDCCCCSSECPCFCPGSSLEDPYKLDLPLHVVSCNGCNVPWGNLTVNMALTCHDNDNGGCPGTRACSWAGSATSHLGRLYFDTDDSLWHLHAEFTGYGSECMVGFDGNGTMAENDFDCDGTNAFSVTVDWAGIYFPSTPCSGSYGDTFNVHP